MALCFSAVLWSGFSCSGASPSDDNRRTRTEYEVKADFLLKIPNFVGWPTNVFPSVDAPLVVSIFGKDPFGNVIDELAGATKHRGHPATVCRLHTVKEAIDKNCHVLFVGSSEEESVEEIVAAIGNKPILTVGDVPGFAARGNMINFVVTNKTVKFEINAKRAHDAGLRISSQLLHLATATTKPRQP
ncbi:MAG: YfiR family protein [Verrucomicrobiota bacterium]|nr:YfiR family protein [Verrucomicrobiota bacterium]